MSGTIINAKNPSNVYQPLNVDASGRLECSVNEIEITAGDISVAVDGLEGLQTSANSTLGNIYSRQDDILTASNAIKLSNDTIATKTSSLQSTNHTDLDNIHSRQDDILTSCNATKLTNDTIATKTSALLTANHTDLNNIYTRQDDILTSSNAIKLTNDTIATKTSSLQSTNHTDLNNIYTRQDDILTATNAVKTNTQSVENCVSSNKMNVNISSGAISGFATESTLQTIAEFNCDTTDVTISSSALPSGASTASLQGGGLPSALSSDNLKVSLKESIAVGVTNTTLTNLNNCIGTNELQVDIVASLPTGSNAIGKLSANSGVDIGDVDVTSLPLTFNSGNKDATCQRVVIATDDVNLSAIKSSLQAIDNSVDGNYLNINQNIAGTDVDANSGNKSGATQRVVIADDDTNLSAIKTAVELLDVCIGTDNSTGPAKCMSIGGTNPIGGNIQEIAVDSAGHLSVDILSSTLPSGASGEISNTVIATKTTLLSSAEVKELLSGVTVNAGALSSEFDTENYERVRFFGETTANTGTDIIFMGSNTSGGTFYVLGENLRSETLSSTHYVYASGTENLPRYIKIFNKSGSTNYVFTKLYLQGSGGRLLV